MSNIITDQALLEALSTTATTVKWIRKGSPNHRIEAPMAICIVKAGRYEGRIRGNQVRYIREIEAPADACQPTNRQLKMRNGWLGDGKKYGDSRLDGEVGEPVIRYHNADGYRKSEWYTNHSGELCFGIRDQVSK